MPLKGNCIELFHIFVIALSDSTSQYSLERIELVLLVKLYESYGQLNSWFYSSL